MGFWRKNGQTGCFVLGMSSGLLWLFFLRRFALVYIPTFRCADFSRELWAGLHGAASMAFHIRGYCSRLLIASFFSSLHTCYMYSACVMAIAL